MNSIARRFSTLTVAAATMAGVATAATSAEADTPRRAAPVNCATVAKPTTAKAYTDKLIQAWGKGNASLAGCYADGQTRDFLFGQNVRGSGWTHSRTQVLDGLTRVTYRQVSGATLQFSVVTSAMATSQPAISAAQGNARVQGRVTTYADKLIRAWGRGDRPAALRLANAATVNKLWAFSGGAGGACWARQQANTGWYEAGVAVSYTCESARVTLSVKPTAAANGTPQAVVNVITQGAG